MIQVTLTDQVGFSAPEETLVDLVHSILRDHDIQGGEVSLAIVDDSTIAAA